MKKVASKVNDPFRLKGSFIALFSFAGYTIDEFNSSEVLELNRKYSEEMIKNAVQQYFNGEPVASLSAELGIPRSTVYSWIKKHRKVKSTNNAEITYQDYHNLKRRYDKLEEKLEVIKAAGCGLSAPLTEKLDTLETLYELGRFSVHALCEALEVSRGTFYNHIFRRKKVTQYDLRREEIREQVQAVFDESKQRFGSKKISVVLAERGIKTSAGYVAELMREMGLQSIGRNSKREYKKQNDFMRRQNKLQQQFDVSEPNRVWVSDTTCFKVKDKYYYICAIIDLFSRKIVGHGISPKHSTYLITSTMRRTLAARGYPQQLMFHSDQGTQYTSKAFQNLLRVNNIVQSYSRSGRPHDNAVAESFFSSLKKEELYRINFKSEREFYECVNEYIIFYNTKRPHGKLAYKTPEHFESLYEAKKQKAS